jgi:eukaryotic-like serine/threonine-protein kinase
MDEAKKSIHSVDRTGQQWGHYRIISSLEQGRFSKAYLGELVSDHSKQFVIDILPMPLTKENVDVFLQQARRLTQLIHPHILHLVDVGVENFVPFVVLDYVSHVPLRQLYKHEPQLLDKVLPYLRQMTTALQFAHDREILHKNLCPDNVLLGWNSGTLLCDFAIDVVNQDEQYQNYLRTKDPVDAMAYAAPEQIHHHANKASDQYALAVMIYEWLCGVPPFQGTYFEMANHHLHTPPTPLRQKAPTVSPAVQEVILTALAKDPTRRFGSVSAFINALSQAYDPKAVVSSPALPPVIVPVPAGPMVSSPPAMPPTPVKADAAVVSSHVSPASTPTSAKPPIVTPAPAALSSNQGVSGSPATPAPAIPAQNAAVSGPPLAARAFAASQTIASPAPSTPNAPPPERRQQKRGLSTRRALVIAVAGLATLGGGGAWLLWKRLYPEAPIPIPVLNTTPPVSTPSPGSAVLVYRAHQARVNGVAWSPDGKFIASSSDDKLVLICDSTNGNTVLTYSGHSDIVNGIAWSPDSQFIASASADKTVQVWEALTGRLVTTYQGHSAAVNSVSWSSNGERIASGSDDTTVQVWAVQNGVILLNYQEHTNSVLSVAWSPDDKKVASGSWDTTVQVFSMVRTSLFAIGDTIFTYKGHTAEVYAVAWAPNGKRLASGGGDNVVQVCNGSNGAAVNYPPRRHAGPVRAVAWSPDIGHIVSGSDDKTVRVWDSSTGENTTTFRRHTDAVFAVDWSPGSKFVVSGGADKTVQVFGIS